MVCAALIVQQGKQVPGWQEWLRARGAALATRVFAAALASIRAGRDRSAIAALDWCLDLTSTDRMIHAQALYHRGSALKRQGMDDHARESFERILEEGRLEGLPTPIRAALHFHLGELDLRQCRHAAALAHLKECLALNPEHARARTLQAEITAGMDAAA
jgi:tetratricopeptide (TPR) repeat protein